MPRNENIKNDKWLWGNSGIVLVQEGAIYLQCYCMYKHHKPNRHRMVWIKWDWDNKYKEVFECQILDQKSVGKQSRKPTDFYMRSSK